MTLVCTAHERAASRQQCSGPCLFSTRAWLDCKHFPNSAQSCHSLSQAARKVEQRKFTLNHCSSEGLEAGKITKRHWKDTGDLLTASFGSRFGEITIGSIETRRLSYWKMVLPWWVSWERSHPKDFRTWLWQPPVSASSCRAVTVQGMVQELYLYHLTGTCFKFV
jgi:hypothetical protein